MKKSSFAKKLDKSLQSVASHVELVEKTDSVGMRYFDVRVYDEHGFYAGGTSGIVDRTRAIEIEAYYSYYIRKAS